MNNIISLPERDYSHNKKLEKAYGSLSDLLVELNKRTLPREVFEQINDRMEAVIQSNQDDKSLRKDLHKGKKFIIDLLRKELELVPKGYYRNMWMALGMTVFGLPIGLIFSSLLGNMAFLGAFLPIGMVIGMGIGSGMDNKAEADGKQLDYTMSI